MDQEIFQYWAAVDKHQNKVVNLFETENQGKEWFRYYKGVLTILHFCIIANRISFIGFPAHCSSKRKADALAQEVA